MPTLSANDIDLYYEVYGQGEPLILIMGLGCDLTLWSQQIQPFSEKYQLIIYDNRGIGRSGIPESLQNYSMDIMVDDLAALMDHLKLTHAHIYGSSMGGAIAQEFAIRYPERVNKLMLTVTTAKFREASNFFLDGIADLIKKEVDIVTRSKIFMAMGYSDNFFTNPEIIEAALLATSQIKSPQPLHGFQGQMKVIREHDTRGRVQQIMADTLVLAGTEDILVLPKQARYLAEHIPQAKLQFLDNAAHCLQFENALEHNQAILQFLAK